MALLADLTPPELTCAVRDACFATCLVCKRHFSYRSRELFGVPNFTL
ncbi:hypothetical protein SAMN05443551_1119 [Marivita hallyeonensis]|uniref:Uncharacterized protein n=1 Tax=Marivita hallyeonensis TaxID=996342 RepID=A0A1M5P1A0_9RHOB|nr:hypothetical protein SAMN05443551_1119 [Marivita hallyeonensis]